MAAAASAALGGKGRRLGNATSRLARACASVHAYSAAHARRWQPWRYAGAVLSEIAW